MSGLAREQDARNAELLRQTPTLGSHITSKVLPFTLDLSKPELGGDADTALAALEKTAARIAIESLVSLAKAGDIDHLGGGLELIGPLMMTLGITNYQGRQFAIEHGHTSIGYYSALAALGFLPRERVIEHFRRSLDMAGHVLWVPGGTPLGSGRLGVMVPVTAGWSIGLRAKFGMDSLVVCHTGDAGWVSGQAMNGFITASIQKAPLVFVMHRNHIQLSGTTARIMDRDPRPIIASLGIEILEVTSLHDRKELFRAYAYANASAHAGKPTLIYPTGFESTIEEFAEKYGIGESAARFCAKHYASTATRVKVPGSLMSYRDDHAMLECLFYVNELPGGEAHHDGGMKGRDGAATLANPMLALTDAETSALDALRRASPRIVEQQARPAAGSPNLVVTANDVRDIVLPGTDKQASVRAGTEAAYVAVAKKFPERCFFVSCDLNPSTKLGKAAALVPKAHQIEMSIQEQAATLVNDGLAFVDGPQLNAFATFAAFMEGIAREGFEFWRYQRNLNGANEGLNVLMHLAHVGACTGRDHFSGWSLDWINLAIGYLPYLHRFYAPADARAGFIAILDAAAHYGGHIAAIPRDNLPVLTKQGSQEPLWQAGDAWTPTTVARKHAGARTAVLAFGAPAFIAISAAEKASQAGVPTDAIIVNGLPLPEEFLSDVSSSYSRVLTIEDGLIGSPQAGLRGFAALVASRLRPSGTALHHFGIVDPSVAPSEHYLQVWEHFGMTEQHLLQVITAK
ncbi:MAG TPA: hypothetical protein VEA16_15785 [Vicinamibacterales bacterium]|nr:hypothetical protein [Vicinamibacterales bacterium]